MRPRRAHARRGIAKLIEGILALILVATGLVLFAPARTALFPESTAGSGAAVLAQFDQPKVLESILIGSVGWEARLFEYVRASLPLGTYFTLNVYRVVGSTSTQLNTIPIGNIDPAELAQFESVSTTRKVLSPAAIGQAPATAADLVDVMLVMDKSGSMNDQNKIGAAKQAAHDFVDVIGNATAGLGAPIWIGLVSFDSTITVQQNLTSNFAAVHSAIDSLSASGSTNIGGGIRTGTSELVSSFRRANGAASVMVFMTDGFANRYIREDTNGTINPSDPRLARAYALLKADQAKNATNAIEVFSITLGTQVDPELGKAIASAEVDDHYFASPSPAQLSDVYRAIATQLVSVAVSNPGILLLELTIGSGA
jgi:Mg-chelatase subunit ChlD